MMELVIERNEQWLTQELDLGNQRLLTSSAVLGMDLPPSDHAPGTVSRMWLYESKAVLRPSGLNP